MTATIDIAGREIGQGSPCFVIAEAGVNHNGDLAIARQLIDAAKQAGADAVKFQQFESGQIVTGEAKKAAYQVETTGGAGDQLAMLQALELTGEDQASLKQYCDRAGITYLCTPYDPSSADLLDRLDIAAYKVASTDTTNIPFLRLLSTKGRPVILSTGMCDMEEVGDAVDALRNGGLADKICLLHCLSEYPAPFAEMNLRAMNTMARAFACPVGYSDHSPGVGASPWAVALGACVIEKHLTLSRDMTGPDHRASIEPHELAELIGTVRQVEAALGDGIKRAMPSEIGNRSTMRKSLVAKRPIAAGQVISADDLTAKRPASGLAPGWLDQVVGRTAAIDVPADTPLGKDHVTWDSDGGTQ